MLARIRPRLFLLVLGLVLVGGCRRTLGPNELRTATAPHIAKIVLNSGNLIQFDDDLGWYNIQDSTIEGTTIDSQQVHYSLKEVRSVETVREYSLVFVYAAALALMGLAAYVLFKLFELV
jgi:hypothetical protein